MPTLSQRRDGRFYIDDTIQGQRVRPVLTLPGPRGTRVPVRDLATAEALFADYLARQRPALTADVDATAAHDAQDPHVRALIDYYLEEHLPAKNAKPRSFTAAAEHLDKFKDFCRARNVGRVSQLTPRTVTEFSNWLTAKPLHAKTVKNHLMTVRAMLNAAAQAQIIPESPIRRWLMPTTEDAERTPLDAAQLGLLLTLLRLHAPADLRLIVTHIATTGNRPSDACTLRRDRLDIDRGYVSRVSVKTRVLKEYPLTTEARKNIREAAQSWQSGGVLVFLTARGNPWTVHSVYHCFTRFVGKMRDKELFPRHVTLKDLRHTFATIVANEPVCVPLPVVQAMMGHATMEMTTKYVMPTAAGEALARFSRAISPSTAVQKTTERAGTTRHRGKKP